MSNEKKLYFGVEVVARLANLVQEGLIFNRNIVNDLRNVEMVEVIEKDEDGNDVTFLVLSEDYLKSLPEEAEAAMKAFVEEGNELDENLS